MFDHLGWPWRYEPKIMRSPIWLPDFQLTHLPDERGSYSLSTLAEVKPWLRQDARFVAKLRQVQRALQSEPYNVLFFGENPSVCWADVSMWPDDEWAGAAIRRLQEEAGYWDETIGAIAAL